jgi:Dolichyl-phosphate-mannose-protein mannosyltransferase
MHMTLGRYLAGVVLGVLVLVPLGVGAVTVRRAVLPGWAGAPARLAESVIGAAGLIGLLELLGAVSLYRLSAAAIAAPALGVAAVLVARRAPRKAWVEPPGGRPPAGDDARLARIATWALALGVGVVFGTWLLDVVRAYISGIFSPDSVWYHMPFAARWVQDHATTGVPYMDVDFLDAFYPGGSEVLHGLGIMLFARDWLSPVINYLWLALAVVAGWCIGRPRGVGPAAAAGVALVLGVPLMATYQAGSANNDAAAMSMLLAAAGLAMNAGEARAPLVLAGVAAGLAIDIKLSLLVPALALVAALIVAEPAGRRRSAVLWLGTPFVAAGAYWYVRNLVATGSPFPFHRLGPLPAAHHPANGTDVALSHYLTDVSIWRHRFVHDLVVAMGRVWPLVLVVGLGGLVLALVARGATRRERAIAVAGLIAAVAYIFTPATAAGPPGHPLQFALNLRYLAPALAVGAALAPGALVAAVGGRPSRVAAWGSVGLTALLLLSEPGGTLWPSDHRAAPAIGVVLTLVAVGAWRAARGRSLRLAPMLAVGTIATAVLIAGGWRLEHRYLIRYQNFDQLGPLVSRWSYNLSDQRIGVVGRFIETVEYPLYGADLTNRVRYVAAREPHGTFATIGSCGSFLNAVDRGRFDWLLVTPHAGLFTLRPLPSPEAGWLRTSPNARLIAQDRNHKIYRITGPLDPRGCRA